MATVLSSRKQALAVFTFVFVIVDIVVVCSVARLNLTNPSDQTITTKEDRSIRLDSTQYYHETLFQRIRSNPRNIRSDCQREEPIMKLTDKHRREFGVVRNNLDKCLQAAELMEYFHDNNLYNKAVRNAAHLFSLVRSILPQNVSTNSSTPCWGAHFEVNLHSKGLVGFFNEKAFTSPKHCWNSPSLNAIESGYYQNKSSGLVCLPSIFLAGFPKCGSTYLYCLLRRLAYLAHARPWRTEIEKEPRMWVGTGPDAFHQYPHQLNDLTRYLFNFMPSVDAALSSQYPLAIDASPNLLFQWPRYAPWESMENYCLLPAVLPQILPSNKYIVVMREPASTLYSAFWYSCSTLNVTLTRQQQIDAPSMFHADVVEVIEIFYQCTEHHPADKCIDTVFHSRPRNSSTRRCLRLRFEMGFYYNYIRRWLATIPKTQFLFLTTEELNTTPPFKDILEFAGISTFDENNASTYSDIKCEKNKSKFNYRSDPALWMRNDTRMILNEFFAPFNQKLSNLLGDDKFLWKK